MPRRVWLVLAVSLAVRLAFVLWADCLPKSDDLCYDMMARNLLNGEGFHLGARFGMRTPGYPLFLAGMYGLVQTNYLWPKLAQAILGVLTTWLVFLLGARVAGEKAGLVAAWIHALSLSSVLYAAQLMTENLACPLVAAALLLLVSRRYAWAGAALGVLILVRPAGVFLIPAFAIAVWTRERAARPLLVTAALCALVVAPWIGRQMAVGAGPCLDTLQGVNLYLGNHEGANGFTVGVRRVDESFTWPEREANRVLFREASHWIVRHPAQYAFFSARRMVWLWGPYADSYLSEYVWPTPERNARAFRDQRQTVEAQEFFHRIHAVTSPLALAALLFAWYRRRDYGPLLWALGFYTLGIGLTFGGYRMAEMVGPLVCVCLGGLGAAAWQWRASRRRTRAEVNEETRASVS